MKRPNITPGPWSLGEKDPLLVDTELWYIASAHANVGEGSSRANARAIAALPDLLTALETAERSLRPATRGALKDYVSPELALIRAALLKAGYTFPDDQKP
jgi:hypothetical protein